MYSVTKLARLYLCYVLPLHYAALYAPPGVAIQRIYAMHRIAALQYTRCAWLPLTTYSVCHDNPPRAVEAGINIRTRSVGVSDTLSILSGGPGTCRIFHTRILVVRD